MSYANLHTHDEYSNISTGLDSINKLDDLIKGAKSLGLKGLAITNHDNLSEVVEINRVQKKLRENGDDFKLMYGNEIYLVEEFEKGNEYDLKRKYWHFILLAKDKIGYDALIELSTRAWYRSEIRRGRRRIPTLYSDLEEVIPKAKGHIIGASACLGSRFDRLVLEGDKDGALKFANWCRNLFGENDFFIELQPSMSDDQIKFNKRAIQFAEYGFNYIITTDAHYQFKEDFPLFEAFLRSQQEKREVQEYYEYARLQSEEEVRELLNYLSKDFVDEALNNTLKIIDQVEFFDLARPPRIPKAPLKEITNKVPEELINSITQAEYPTLYWAINSDDEQTHYCITNCLNSLYDRKVWNKQYLSRLEEEFDVFKFQSDEFQDNFFKYFNTMQHYLDLAWSIDCAVGPSRGSASGSIICYLMDIVQCDPIQYGLYFWRFANKVRTSPLDIDTDFMPSKRPLLFEKIREERGELGLTQVATYKTLTLKAAIGNAARGYRSQEFPNGLDPDISTYLSSLIEIKRGFVATLKQTLEGDETMGYNINHSFIKECQQYPGLLEIIKKIEGLIVNSSTHAAAVIFFDEDDKLTDHCSLMRSPNGDLCTALDLHTIEETGAYKYDFLLLSSLDIIGTTFDLLKKDGVIPNNLSMKECFRTYINPNKIDYNDHRIWHHFFVGDVLSVFQWDAASGRKGLLSCQPQTLEELTAVNGLIRLMSEDGTEDQISRFVRIKDNPESFEEEMLKSGLNDEQRQIMHEELDRYNGCAATQESFMILSQKLAKYTLKQADALRKTVAKKKMSEIEKQKELFYSQCEGTQHVKDYLWSVVIQPSLGYGFSLNHALPYSIIGVQCVLLGGILFSPIYWQTACLLQRSGALDGKAADYNKIAKAVSILSKQGVKITALDINKSDREFRLDANENQIYFGLMGVKGLKEKVIEAILTYRPFENLQDFISKCNPDVTSLVCLTKAGAFDNFGPRGEIIDEIAELKCGAKLRLNGQNLLMLSRENLWPTDDYALECSRRIFNFTHYLKQQLPKTKEERAEVTRYKLDKRSIEFLEEMGHDNLIEIDGENSYLPISSWKFVFDVEMGPIKRYLIEHQEEMLEIVNKQAKEKWLEKYFPNNDFAQWEIETMGLCFGEHPMTKVIEHYNNDDNPKSPKFADFEQLSQEPEPAYFFEKNGKKIPMYDLYMICGIVIAKDKIKGMITLLTPTGPVDVKFGKNRFANYDKQISKIINGKKTVIEKSWFNRGEKIMVHGFRIDDIFCSKRYKNSPMIHTVYKITEIGDDGRIQIQQERKLGMMEESDEND